MTDFDWSTWGFILVAIMGTFAVIVISLNAFMAHLERKRLLSVRLSTMGSGNSAKSSSEINQENLLFIAREHNIIERKIAQYLSHFQSEHKLQIFLYQCGLKISLTKMLVVFLIVSFLMTFILLAFGTESIKAILYALLFSLILLYGFLSIVRGRRRAKFEEHFPMALDILSRSIKSGHSLEKALRIVAHEIPAPVGSEFARILQQIEVGQNFEQAMREGSMRVGSRNFTFLMDALIIQHETGGRLEEIIQNIIDVQRRRRKLVMKMQSSTAEVRGSMVVVAAIPIFLGCILFYMKPDYMSFFYKTADGIHLTKIALALFAAEILLAKWILTIDMD